MRRVIQDWLDAEGFGTRISKVEDENTQNQTTIVRNEAVALYMESFCCSSNAQK
jgi:hypothetical protein